jgi:hypothetical protein
MIDKAKRNYFLLAIPATAAAWQSLVAKLEAKVK